MSFFRHQKNTEYYILIILYYNIYYNIIWLGIRTYSSPFFHILYAENKNDKNDGDFFRSGMFHFLSFLKNSEGLYPCLISHLLLRNIITIYAHDCEYISNIILHFQWSHSHVERWALLLYSCFFWDYLTSYQALRLSILCLPDTHNIGFVYLCMFGM